ncbi:MAG: cell division protein SepF, partial [Pseudonocardia sp.]|nr:cell division protein SepF [Pseudonocardia sp.]
AMYRLKAYFGMVPAEEMDYAEDPEAFPEPRRPRRDDRWADPDDRYGDYDEYRTGRAESSEDSESRFGTDWSRRSAREPVRSARDREPVRGSGGMSLPSSPAVRGALAVDPDTVREPAPREVLRPVSDPVSPMRAAGPMPEQRDRGAAALARITTLQPRSYNEARTIGERYRDGVPVIMNLTELDDAAAKRLVDFAAGLAFALRGSIDKVTSRVFLLTPADVEVSADDARKLAERGLFRQD